MSVANLQRYDIEEGVSPHNHYGKIVPDADGDFCKFEEAMEASSNSLQQLKAKIAALIPKIYQAYYDSDVTPEQFEPVINELRQLSAV